MVIPYTDPVVLAAIIQSVGSLLAAITAAISMAVIGKRFLNRKRLQSELIAAVEDIAYLLVVEEEHCKIHRISSGESCKQTIRELARSRGFSWSGNYTPGRARNRSLLKEPIEL